MKGLAHLLGIGILVIILSTADLGGLTEILGKASALLVGMSLGLHLLIVLIRAYKWQYIMQRQGLGYGLWDCCVMYASGMYLGLVTPGRIGEFGRVWYIKEKHSFGTSMWSVFIDRLTDLLVLGLIASAGVWYFGGGVWVFGLYLMAVILGVAFIWLKGNGAIEWVFLLFPKLRQKMRENVSDFLQGAHSIRPMDGLWVVWLTFVVWLLYLLQVYLMSLSLELQLSFAFVGFSVALAGVVSLLPVTVFGVGTRDATFIFLFGLAGLGSEPAIALSLMMLLIFLFSAGFGYAAWTKKPIRKL